MTTNPYNSLKGSMESGYQFRCQREHLHQYGSLQQQQAAAEAMVINMAFGVPQATNINTYPCGMDIGVR